VKRVAAALSAFVLVLTCVTAAPVPMHLFPKTPVYYYPTTVGTTWVYKDDDEEFTLVVSGAERTDDGVLVSVQRVTGGGQTDHEKMLVSASGLIKVECFGKKLEPPLVMLKFPNKLGDSWTSSDPEGTDTVRGVEKITVPAGTFDALRVDAEYTLAGQKMKTVFWYEAGVGIVKWIHRERETRVLKSFTRGKE